MDNCAFLFGSLCCLSDVNFIMMMMSYRFKSIVILQTSRCTLDYEKIIIVRLMFDSCLNFCPLFCKQIQIMVALASLLSIVDCKK